MKKVDIPIIERKNSSNDIDNLITNAKNTLGINKSNNIIKSNSIISIYENISIDNLYYKYMHGIKLTKEDLIVLYNIYHYLYNISEFDKERLESIKTNRSYIDDLMVIFDCKEDEITSNINFLDSNPSKYVVFLGDFGNYISTYRFKHVYENLKYIRGNLYLNDPVNYNNNLPSLEVIDGRSFLSFKKSSGFENLKCFGNGAFWYELLDASSLTNLEIIGGHVSFDSLKSAKGLNNLKIIRGDADFPNLLSSDDLENLQKINGTGYFCNLSDISHLSNLAYVYDMKCSVFLSNTDKEKIRKISIRK